MNDTDELDRVWRDGLRRLAEPTTSENPVPMVTMLAPRHRGRAVGSIAAAVAIIAVIVGGLAVGHDRAATTVHSTSTVSAPARPLVVNVVDAPGGTLTLALPGRKVSGQPPHVELSHGLIEFRIDMRSAGHELRLDGVDAFAPTPTTPGLVTRTVRLAPGIYRLYCAIPGHAEAGEQILLDVR